MRPTIDARTNVSCWLIFPVPRGLARVLAIFLSILSSIRQLNAADAAATKPIPKMPDNKISHGTIPGVLKNIPITAVKTISELTLNLQRVRKFLIFSAFI